MTFSAGPLRWPDCGNRAEDASLLAGHAVLDRLARMIETPPAEWLTRLVAGHALPRSEYEAVSRQPGEERR